MHMIGKSEICCEDEKIMDLELTKTGLNDIIDENKMAVEFLPPDYRRGYTERIFYEETC